MIKIKNLTFSYDKEIILDDFNLSVEKGECIGIKGKSGSGKTTLLRLIAGLEDIQRGQIFINGKEISHVPAYKRNVGFIFQNFALFPHIDVKKNILFGIKNLPKAVREERLNNLTELFEINAYLDRYPHEISQGQKQRVAVSRALVCDPDVLLFDEPFSALDSDIKGKMRLEIKAMLKKLKITSFIVSHDDEDLAVICDRIIDFG